MYPAVINNLFGQDVLPVAQKVGCPNIKSNIIMEVIRQKQRYHGYISFNYTDNNPTTFKMAYMSCPVSHVIMHGSV